MAAPPQIVIAGVDRTDETRAEISIEATLGARTTCSLTTRDPVSSAAAYRPALDQALVVRDPSGTPWFAGAITNLDDQPVLAPDAGVFSRVAAVSTWRAAAARRVKLQFAGVVTLKAAATAVAGYLAVYGITLDPAMGTGPSFDGLTFDEVTAEDAFNRLAELSGWVYRLTPANVIEFFPIGTKAHAITLSANNKNVIGGATWTQTRDTYFNTVIVRYGGASISAKEDRFTGTGSIGHFLLTYPTIPTPDGGISSQGYVLENGVHYPLARWGVDTGYVWYYNPENNHLMRQTPAPAGADIQFIYNVQFPQTVRAEDAADIAARGPWEELIEAPDIYDKAEAQALAESRRRRSQTAPRVVTLRTRIMVPFQPGDTITLDLPTRTLPASAWLITAVSITADLDHTLGTTLTLLEGTEQQESWIDFWRRGFGHSSTAAGVVSGSYVPPPTGGGGTGDLTGTGTPGELAIWTGPKILAESDISVSMGKFTGGGTGAGFTIDLGASTIVGTLPAANLPPYIAFTNLANVFTTSPQTIIAAEGQPALRLRANSASAVLNFTNNAGTVTTASVLSNLTLFSLWSSQGIQLSAAGNITLSPDSGTVYPGLTYRHNLGSLSTKWLQLHAAELWVETLVAQQTIATIGGRILVGPTTILARPIAAGGAQYITIYVKHNSLKPYPSDGVNWGSTLIMETAGKFEAFQVVSTAPAAPEADGSYAYAVARFGTTYHPWEAGDAVFDTGITGSGFIDLYSVSGLAGSGYTSNLGPTIVGNVRTSALPGAWQYWAPRWAIGNLNGLYGHSANTYGAAFGDPAGANLTIDPINGIAIRSGVVSKFYADASGNLTLAGNLTINASGVFRTAGATSLTDGAGIYMAGGPTPVWRVGDPNPANPKLVKWDGSTLTIGMWTVDAINFSASNISMNASGLIRVGTNGSTDIWMSSYDSSGARIWIGPVLSSSALLRINSDGTMSAQSVSASVMYAQTFRVTTNSTYMYLHGMVNGQLAIRAGAAWILYLNEATNGGVNGLFPSSTNDVILGQPANRWKNIYTMAVDNASDRAVKTEVRAGRLGLAFLEKLPVHTFTYTTDPERTPGQYGFMTDEVRAALDGEPFAHLHEHGLDYARFVPVLTRAIQELAARLRDLER